MTCEDAVRSLRQLLGLSGQALGLKLGVSYKTISRYEQGQLPSTYGLMVLSRLAKEIGQQKLAQVFQELRKQKLKQMAPALSSPGAARRVPVNELRQWSEELLEISASVRDRAALERLKAIRHQIQDYLASLDQTPSPPRL